MNTARKALLLGALLGLAPRAIVAAEPTPSSAESDPEWRQVLELYRGMLVPRIVLNPDGTAPGYVPDPLPIEGSVADVVAMLERDGEQMAASTSGSRIYTLRREGEFLPTLWMVEEVNHGTAVARSRQVTDGQVSVLAHALLCEPGKPEACARLDGFLRKSDYQYPGTPPPAGLLVMLEAAE